MNYCLIRTLFLFGLISKYCLHNYFCKNIFLISILKNPQVSLEKCSWLWFMSCLNKNHKHHTSCMGRLGGVGGRGCEERDVGRLENWPIQESTTISLYIQCNVLYCFICRPCVGGCWDWTQDCSNVGIGIQKLDLIFLRRVNAGRLGAYDLLASSSCWAIFFLVVNASMHTLPLEIRILWVAIL